MNRNKIVKKTEEIEIINENDIFFHVSCSNDITNTSKRS